MFGKDKISDTTKHTEFSELGKQEALKLLKELKTNEIKLKLEGQKVTDLALFQRAGRNLSDFASDFYQEDEFSWDKVREALNTIIHSHEEAEKKEQERMEREKEFEAWSLKKEQKLAEKKKKNRCFMCGREGHIKKFCWNRNEKFNKNNLEFKTEMDNTVITSTDTEKKNDTMVPSEDVVRNNETKVASTTSLNNNNSQNSFLNNNNQYSRFNLQGQQIRK